MLQSMRKSAKSWVMSILFGFLILSFAVWGIGDIFRGGGYETVVAEVGGEEISQTAFIREYQRELERLQQRLGGRITPEMLGRLGLGPQVAVQMTERTLLDRAARDLGILVPDEAVAEAIRTDPSFQAGLGGFTRIYYEQAVRAAGFTVAGYEARLRQDLGRDHLIQAIAASETPPKSLTDKLYKYRGERRVAEFLRVQADAAGVATPDQSAIEAWYKDHQRDFMAPEFRAVTAILLRPEDLMSEIEIPEEQLAEAYERRKDEFSVPEKRTATQVLFADEATAQKAHDLIAGGKSLGEAAKETDSATGEVELGALTRNEMLPEIVDAVFALQNGAYTTPLRSPLGWHIVKVTKIEAGSVQPFDAVRATLEEEFKREQAVEALYEIITGVEDELAAGTTMEETGRSLNVPVVKIAAVDARGNGPDGKPVADLPKEPEFLRTAFAVDEGIESDLVETQTGTAFILKVDKITAPAVRPLPQVRDQIVSAWKADKALEKARATAKEIEDAIKSGAAVSDVAGKHGLAPTTSEPFTRDGAGEDLPATLVRAVFAADRGGVVVADDGPSVIVAQVKDLLGSDPQAADAGRKAIAQELAAAIASDLLAGYSAALQQTYPVEINSSAINQALQLN